MKTNPSNPSSSGSERLTLRRRTAIAGLLCSVLVMAPVWASDKDDHEQARKAVQAGQILPLPTLLEKLQGTHPGQVLEVELEREDGRWIYEIKLLQGDGQLLKLEVDAGTAEVLKVKRKDKGQRKAEPAGETKP